MEGRGKETSQTINGRSVPDWGNTLSKSNHAVLRVKRHKSQDTDLIHTWYTVYHHLLMVCGIVCDYFQPMLREMRPNVQLPLNHSHCRTCQTGVAVGVDWARIRACWAGVQCALCGSADRGDTDWSFFPCCVEPHNRKHSEDREDFNPTWRDSQWIHDGAKWHSWETRWVGVAHRFTTPGLTR